MNMKRLFKYGLIGAIFIGILAIMVTSDNVPQRVSDMMISGAGVVIFLTLGILFTKSIRQNTK